MTRTTPFRPDLITARRSRTASFVGLLAAFLVSSFPILPAELHAGSVVLEPRADCTKEACMDENPCCNECRLRGWSVQGEPGLVVQVGEKGLPDCRLDDCGRCPFILKAEGRRDGRKFIVARWWRVPSDASRSSPLLHVRLTARTVCTMQKCSAARPCCNSCGFRGWRVVGRPELEVRSVAVKLPSCTPDGCGRCNIGLLASGRIRGTALYVESFEMQQEPVALPAFQELPCPPPMNPVRRKLATVKLYPSTNCTRRACSGRNPCCNSCRFSGYVDGFGRPAVALCGDLPTCVPDGCGRCPVEYEAKGYLSDGNFIVTSFRRVVTPAPEIGIR